MDLTEVDSKNPKGSLVSKARLRCYIRPNLVSPSSSCRVYLWGSWVGEGSVGDPDLVESLHDFLIDDEDDGNVHTHAAQARNGAFVEPVGNQMQESVTTLIVLA